jgi:hypothetical protein
MMAAAEYKNQLQNFGKKSLALRPYLLGLRLF